METTPTGADRVKVPLAGREYDIIIGAGLLPRAGEALTDLGVRRCAIVTDERVAPLHLSNLAESLRAAGIAADQIILPPGEQTKSFTHLETLSCALLDLGLERGDVIIALGGGVIGDLAGFAAAILKRGVRLVQIPTTLLAQVDSSIGGKTGINTRHGKNLIGAFHQPSLVIIDTDVLKTLDERQLRAGYAEVAKYGLLGDAVFFRWLEDNAQRIFAGDEAARRQAIKVSCEAKAAIVAEDETEQGRRALLNLGHTFGHALEAWAGYSATLLHGEAVSIGMVLAFEISEELGLCEAGSAARVAAHLQAANLPTSIKDLALKAENAGPSADQLVALMVQDKKVKAGKIALILVRGIGKAFVSTDVNADQIRDFLAARCQA